MSTDNRTNEPTETQVKLAYLAHLKAPRTRGMDVYGPMRAALTAAGVAPQAATGVGELAELPTETPASWSVGLDPEKVAGVLSRHEPIFKDGQYAGRCICGFEHPSYSGWRLHRSRALCAAYTEGRLTK